MGELAGAYIERWAKPRKRTWQEDKRILEKDIIPFTNAGITIVDTRLKSRLDEYGVKQNILVEGSIETSFPKRSEVSSSDRDDRLLPDGTFQAELQGGINKIVVRGTVFI